MPPKVQLSPYKQHAQKWSNCKQCPLHETRRNVVLLRGKLPCDILFVGEAPGTNEDDSGMPFWGPAGNLLEQLIEAAQVVTTLPKAFELRLAFTNLCACIPLDPETGRKTVEPPEEAIEACEPRLIEAVRLSKPRTIVCVGKLARKRLSGEAMFSDNGEDPAPWMKPGVWINWWEITHPAAILRAPKANQGLMEQNVVVTLAEAMEELCLS